jgi:SAM-dependent methyltransferase
MLAFLFLAAAAGLPLPRAFLRGVATSESAAAQEAAASANATAAHALAALAALSTHGNSSGAAWEMASLHAVAGRALWAIGQPQDGISATDAAVRLARRHVPAGDVTRGSELLRWQLRLGRMYEGAAAAAPEAAAAASLEQAAIEVYRQSLCLEWPPANACGGPPAAGRGGAFTALALEQMLTPGAAGEELFARVVVERAQLALAGAREAAARLHALLWQAGAGEGAGAGAWAGGGAAFDIAFDAALRGLRASLGHPCVALALQHEPIGTVDLEMAVVAARRELVLALAGSAAVVVIVPTAPAWLVPAPVWLRALPLQPLLALALQAFASEYVWYRGMDELAAVAALRDAAARALVAAGAATSPGAERAVSLELGQWRHVLALVGSYEPLGGERSKLPAAALKALLAEPALRRWRRERRAASGSSGGSGGSAVAHGEGDASGGWDEAAEGAWEELIDVQIGELAQEEALVREGAALLPLHAGGEREGHRAAAAADEVGRAVKAQYEQHPYPRWEVLRGGRDALAAAGLPTYGRVAQRVAHGSLRSLLSATCPGCTRALSRAAFADEAVGAGHGLLRVLVAGSGTGQQPISTAIVLPHAAVTAVDLSAHSLAYARRKAAEAGLLGATTGAGAARLAFFRGNLLDLPALDGAAVLARQPSLRQRSGRTAAGGGHGATGEREAGLAFDLVKCNGVLHHMAEPEAGLKALVSVLSQGGVLHLGLYSARAVNATRRATMGLAREPRFGDGRDDGGIRLLRREAMLRSEADPVRTPADLFTDWYSLSGTRDLLFHVHERFYTPAQLRGVLHRAGLRFVAFDLPAVVLERFRAWLPADARDNPSAEQSLELWDAFEQAFPDTFVKMLSFYAQHNTCLTGK